VNNKKNHHLRILGIREFPSTEVYFGGLVSVRGLVLTVPIPRIRGMLSYTRDAFHLLPALPITRMLGYEIVDGNID
jgi:hypothetical protein